MRYHLKSLVAGSLFAAATANAAVFEITESEIDRYGFNNEKVTLFFSVNNTYNDILEFAVGNDTGIDAGYRDDLASQPTTRLTEAYMAEKINGSWQQIGGEGTREITWMNNASNFDSFTRAFLFTSEFFTTSCDPTETTCPAYYLETGITDGYTGDARDPQSPVAAYSESLGVDNPILGITVIPVPAAVWLFSTACSDLSRLRAGRGINEPAINTHQHLSIKHNGSSWSRFFFTTAVPANAINTQVNRLVCSETRHTSWYFCPTDAYNGNGLYSCQRIR